MKIGDLSNVEAWRAGGPPPPGSYLCRIDDAKEGESRNGFPQAELSWTVTEGEYQGAEIREWVVFTERTKGKIKALVEVTGVPTPGGELKVADLIGRTAEVVMRQEPSYKDPDKMVTRVAGYKPVSEQRVAAAAAAGNGHGGGEFTPAPGETDLPF